MLIFEKSRTNCRAYLQAPYDAKPADDMPSDFLRKDTPCMAAVSELEVVRHYTQLSQKNFSIDTNFYPLGSCTMKYNPRAAHKLASLPGFLNHHPFCQRDKSQGTMQCLYELQHMLTELTGMQAISLAPMAGAQGEFAGVAMIKAYHQARGDNARCEIIVPDAAHGTNPASAVVCGYQVREIATGKNGDIDLNALQSALGPQTAGIMLTNPSTLGLFERQIQQIAAMVHAAGALLYYDGANLNAIMGKARPGDMGFDVMHINLHKTFATPHGGGGPGSGPVAVGQRLIDYLPVPFVARDVDGYHWVDEQSLPTTIGRMSGFMGNTGILLRAFAYGKLLGGNGLKRASEHAVLNANYLQEQLRKAGFTIAYSNRRASHEFLITLHKERQHYGITAVDFCKALLDYGLHAPTMYFPLIVPECLLIEPTETECKRELDSFVDAMTEILATAKTHAQKIKDAPLTQPVRRLDDVKAARALDLTWKN